MIPFPDEPRAIILCDVNVKINEGIAAERIATSLRAQKQAEQAFRTTKPSENKAPQQKPEVKKFDVRRQKQTALALCPHAEWQGVCPQKNRNRSQKEGGLARWRCPIFYRICFYQNGITTGAASQAVFGTGF
jgi:hypothetical protein